MKSFCHFLRWAVKRFHDSIFSGIALCASNTWKWKDLLILMMTELLSISRWLVLFYLANEPSLLRILSDLFYYLFVCLFVCLFVWNLQCVYCIFCFENDLCVVINSSCDISFLLVLCSLCLLILDVGW